MKRSQSRAPSPTPTAFSGISNYRTDSYRPVKDRNAPPVPQIDYRSISRTHFGELSRYLAAYLARATPASRSSARQKLTRLTIQQFHELSTDVYDELIRRKNEKEVPFLPVREEFHPKRNQARQKLATLPTSRFEDLSSDVYYELARRYPEFKEEALPSGSISPGSTYDDYPSPEFSPAQNRMTSSRNSGRASVDRGMDSGYGDSVSSRRPSQDRRRPSEVDYPVRRSEDNYPGRRSEDSYRGRVSEDRNRSRDNESPYSSPNMASRRKLSQDTTRRSEDRDRRDEFGRRPSAASGSIHSDSTANAQSTTATSGMIIPNTSTMEEEYIEVPYGRDRDVRGSGSTTTAEDNRDRRDTSQERGYENEPDTASDYPSPSPMSPPRGLAGLSARLRGVEDDDDIGAKSPDDYYDRDRTSVSRASINSDRSNTGITGRLAAAAKSTNTADQEKMRRDYELRIATMQTQITNLQRDLEDSQQDELKLKDSEARVQQMEEELNTFRRRAEEQTSAMRNLQKELEELRETRQLEKEREARRAQEDEDELQILRDRIERLEDERSSGAGSMDAELVDKLRSDMQNLITELGDLQRRNDELSTINHTQLISTRDLEHQVKDYKRKYEQAKTELRSVKATSQLFLQAPKMDKAEDQLPVSPEGGVLDIHVTAFLSAVDSLLTAGRSNAPTRVLTPMKSIVNAVTAITDDIRTFERKPRRPDVDYDGLRFLRERAEATLSNLAAAAKTHATSSGMSPVSLLDAAASHVAATITDIGKAISIRKATKIEQEQFTSYSPSPSVMSRFSPALRSVEEDMSSPKLGGRYGEDYGRRPPSENSSSEQTNSPPPIFDQPTGLGMTSDGDVAEDNWAELKASRMFQLGFNAHLTVLSGVRSPTPSPTLNENVTQIITIVSSIVAVCKDNFPAATAQQGNEILRELSEHANKLSEVQALPEVTKESRQIMAKSSFAVANAMKGLMKL
ncbi:component of the polarisome [Marasmius crinis-equi]|uniref:Component of the polarisome n=1 Tax=Marasmius crinis-equi TaxID=585013 RepID=A0ABR3FQP2_9AGAR